MQKQGVVVQNVLHRDAVKGGELARPGEQADPAVVRAGGSATPNPAGNGTAAPDQQKLCLKARDPRTGTVAQRLASRITGRIKGAACGQRMERSTGQQLKMIPFGDQQPFPLQLGKLHRHGGTLHAEKIRQLLTVKGNVKGEEIGRASCRERV